MAEPLKGTRGTYQSINGEEVGFTVSSVEGNLCYEGEVGLVFAGADLNIPEGEFVPTPTLALRIVRAAISKATAEHKGEGL